MNTKIFTTLIGTIGFIASGLAFGQTQVPNTFQAGQPARAAEVNENFTAVEASVDDNAAGIALNSSDIQANTSVITAITMGSGAQLYSQGVSIGQFLTTGGNNDHPIFVLSDQGYIFSIGSEPNPNYYLGGELAIRFSELGCAGDAYIDTANQSGNWTRPFGVVLKADPGSPSPVYYIPRGSASMPGVVIQSIAQNSQCLNTASIGVFYAAFPNDQAITGVSNTAPLLPLMIGLP